MAGFAAMIGDRTRAVLLETPGSLTMRGVRLRTAVAWAYGVRDFQVTGPDWMVIAGVTRGVAPLLGLVGWAMWRAGERITGAEALPSLR